MTDKDVYNPLERATYEAIAYNAVGRASEIGTYPAYALVHSTGNSGWSVGIVQWDFGQPGRGHKVDLLLGNYQAWAPPNQQFSDADVNALSSRLKNRGQVGNALTQDEQSRLNAYLRSDGGREFVNGLNREQIDYKWTKVGEPLSGIEWLRDLGATDPEAAAEIVAMASKLFNQNENRGGRLVRHLQAEELSSGQVAAWIGSEGIDGLNRNARAAIVSGRDSALAGIRLMNALEVGDCPLARRWHDVVHVNGDVALAGGFNFNPDLQLFDAMMRHPTNGLRILEHVEHGRPGQHIVIAGINPLARLEMARIEVDGNQRLAVTGPKGFAYSLSQSGWSLTSELPAKGRDGDIPDHFELGRAAPLSSIRPGHVMRDGVSQHLRALYAEHGLAPAEEQLERTVAGVMRNAQRAGMTEVTLLRFSVHHATGHPDPQGRLIAWQGDPLNPATRWSATPVQEAAQADPGEVLRQFEVEAQRQHQPQTQVAALQQGGPHAGGHGLH